MSTRPTAGLGDFHESLLCLLRYAVAEGFSGCHTLSKSAFIAGGNSGDGREAEENAPDATPNVSIVVREPRHTCHNTNKLRIIKKKQRRVS